MKVNTDGKCDMLGCLHTATKMATVRILGHSFQRYVCDHHAHEIFEHPEEYGIVVEEIVTLESTETR